MTSWARLALAALAVLLVLTTGASAAVFLENFDSYSAGSQMHGQGGWAGWDNNSGAGALVSNAHASSSPNSVDINGASDLVHTFSGLTTGKWTISANQYVPSSSAGTSYAVFLNQYNPGGPYDWSLDMSFDMGTNTVTTIEGTPTPRALVKDQWVPIRIEVDLDSNVQNAYYNDQLVVSTAWYTATKAIGAIDLFANSAGSVYYDDIAIEEFTCRWTSGDGSWNTAANWTPQQVPNLNGQDHAVIGNGATVTYPSNTLGDLTINGGRSLTISGGSTWEQSENTHWTRINNGTLAVDGGTFQRPGGGNVVMPFDSNSNAHMSLTNGAVFDIGGELWLGHNDPATSNQVATVDIDGSTLTTAAAIWFWDTDAAGNEFSMNFTGADKSTVTTDWLGRRDSAHGAQNDVLWETLWDEGLVLVNGLGAADGLLFDDFFVTSGNPGPFNGPYTLEFQGTAVPEPSAFMLAALGMAGLALIGWRRRG